MKLLHHCILAFSLGVALGYGFHARSVEPSRPIELQGVGCDLWIIYPVDLEMLDDEEVRI